MPQASPLVTFGLPAVAALVVVLAALAVRAAAPGRTGRFLAVAAAWILFWSGLALAGVLARVDLRPPPFALLAAGMLGGGLALGLSPLGAAVARALPLAAIVGFQAFRLPLELVMHQAALDGVMPVEMTFTGLNFDIASGVAAIVVAVALRRGAGTWLASAFAGLSAALLLAILGVALAASPMVRAFGPPPHVNSWVAYFPYVLLPVVCVVGALAGQVVLVRKLRGLRRGASSEAGLPASGASDSVAPALAGSPGSAGSRSLPGRS